MPAELDNLDPAMDQTGAETPDMGSDPMGSEGPEMGHGDQEGAMAKQELIKLANYATNLQEHIEDNEQLEAWVQSKITLCHQGRATTLCILLMVAQDGSMFICLPQMLLAIQLKRNS